MLHLPVRRAVPFFILALLGLAFAAGAADAAVPSPGPVIEMQLYEWGIEPSGVVLAPGANVTFHITNRGLADHNLYVGQGGSVAKYDPLLKGGESANLTFTVPDEGAIYYCNVGGHLELGMVGNLTLKGAAPAAAAGTGAPTPAEIRALGVSYFAYWVGVVSFIVLFVVVAATFFLLRFGESKHWTDQTARPVKDKGEAPRAPMGTWVVLGIVLLVFVVAAVQVVRVV